MEGRNKRGVSAYSFSLAMALLFLLAFSSVISAGMDAMSYNASDPYSNPMLNMGNTTAAMREAAAIRAAIAARTAKNSISASAGISAIPGGTPDYFGTTPNYANSPLPQINLTSGAVTGGMRKFVDSLPGLGAANANDLGQYIPIAIPDQTTYPGSDYYEIELGQYAEQMHADLPPTTLRGYRQTNTNDSTVSQFHYLGPIIIAQKDRPVRIKFTNSLPTGAGGDLFIPVDPTIMGAGMGPDGMMENYTQNRATLHLHGGNTPWISDGTMHQWITPAGENTSYPRGVSVQNVPDMPDPGPGSETFYYTNQQSARLMFYHDHAYGITRLNVYAGEAAGYLVQDPVESALVSAGTIPADQIPLIIQDKAFVPSPAQLAAEDPTWNTAKYGGMGNLWFPHVYMPNQNPADITGANAMGRWDYGPWFWPPFTGIVHGTVPNPLAGTKPGEGPLNPGTPNPSAVPEAFVDTPVVNGNAYPYQNVGQKPYRLRILDAANDRFFNLQVYYASTPGPFAIFSGGGGIGASAKLDVFANGSIANITLTSGGAGFTSSPTITIFDAPGHYPAGSGAQATAAIDPATGTVASVALAGVGTGYAVPTVCKGPGAPPSRLCTEVSMVPASPNAGVPFPADWLLGTPGLPMDILDGRAGGVPDPRTMGPNLIQIGTEGGFLPAPVVIPNRPIGYEKNTRSITVTNVLEKALFIGPAERADAIVDFSAVPDGSTLILYNDAPAPVPAFDPRNDYYTDDMDQQITGGAPSTIPGYGPNTRTVMQFRVNSSLGTAAAFNLAALQTALPSAYAQSQPPPIVPQAAYNAAFNQTGPADAYVRISDNNMTIFNGPIYGVNVTSGGSGYVSPSVQFSGGGGSGAAATAIIANGTIIAINVTNGGSNYTSAPTVTITDPSGTGANATALGTLIPLQPKAIQELFEANYGRMNAILGVELPFTNMITQTTIPFSMVDPPSEVLRNTDPASQIGALADGTQIWKITHNGVDTHALHWHMYNVQLINRVGWDGMIKPPDPNELGWKETIRMNPLEDIIVAIRPIIPNVPFSLPNSVRPSDATAPVGSTGAQFSGIDVGGHPVTVANPMINFGWEYVWHCHLLGHEENDMMRPVAITVAPSAPTGLSANVIGGGASQIVTLTWTDNSTDETAFTVQRSTSPVGPWTTITTVPSIARASTGGSLAYADTSVAPATTYYYRVLARNVAGDATIYPSPAIGYPTITADSVPSNTATATTG